MSYTITVDRTNEVLHANLSFVQTVSWIVDHASEADQYRMPNQLQRKGQTDGMFGYEAITIADTDEATCNCTNPYCQV